MFEASNMLWLYFYFLVALHAYNSNGEQVLTQHSEAQNTTGKHTAL